MSSIAREITRFSKKEIESLFKHARRVVRHSYVDILKAPRLKEFGRILVIASAKTGNAVQRNKVKRQIRALFYQKQYYLLPYDIIWISKKGSAPLFTFETLAKLLEKAYS